VNEIIQVRNDTCAEFWLRGGRDRTALCHQLTRARTDAAQKTRRLRALGAEVGAGSERGRSVRPARLLTRGSGSLRSGAALTTSSRVAGAPTCLVSIRRTAR
jgi:hypothetical protein